MPHKSFETLYRKYGTERYWYLRKLHVLAKQLNVTEFNQWLPVLQDMPIGEYGFKDLISFLLVMHEARKNSNLIDEEKRNNCKDWNCYFRENVLATFPLEENYQRMYTAAENMGIKESLFPIHVSNRSPIAKILNYCGYIYLKLLDNNVNFETLSKYSNMTVEELKDAKQKIEQIRNNILGVDVEEIAEKLQISPGIAKRICDALNADDNGNPPRIIRRDGQLKYLLPKEVNFCQAEETEEIIFRFTNSVTAAKTRVRYKIKSNNIWRHPEQFETLSLENCSEINIISKHNGISQNRQEELKPIYIFEGVSEHPKEILRSNIKYAVLKSGVCPKNAETIVEYPEGKQEKFIGQCLPVGGRLLLVENEKILLSYDVNTGNEIGFFTFQDAPVSYVSRRDIPCFSCFPDFEIDIDDAEIFINATAIQRVDLENLYGDILVELKYQNSIRKKRCRILPADFKISIEINGCEREFSPDGSELFEFSQRIKFIFSSEHLKDKKVEFLLPEMETNVETVLSLDNDDFIPVKFKIHRNPGAFVSLRNNKIPLVSISKDKEVGHFDWDEFKEFGTLQISRKPNQKFAVLLYNGNRLLGGAKFQTLELSYADLCDIVNYNEAELLNVTKVQVWFEEGNQGEYVNITCHASSLERVLVRPKQSTQDLCLIIPCPQSLRINNLFLVLKKVEDQAAENLVVISDKSDLEVLKKRLPSSCHISEQRCTVVKGKYEEKPAIKMTIPGFYAPGQTAFPAKAYLGFILKPGKNSGFVRCNQGIFIQTDWSPENEQDYWDSLLYGREFLDNKVDNNIRILEEGFKTSNEQICHFIDEFLKFGVFSQAQPFMDVCFHYAVHTERGKKYFPSGYIFLAEKYWFDKLNRGENIEELFLYWDPELFTLETLSSFDFKDITEDYKETWPSLYLVNCLKKHETYTWVSEKEVEQEMQRVNQQLTNPKDALWNRDLEKYIVCLLAWRACPTLRKITYHNNRQEEFYELRKGLQILRHKYQKCYRYVAECAYVRNMKK